MSAKWHGLNCLPPSHRLRVIYMGQNRIGYELDVCGLYPASEHCQHESAVVSVSIIHICSSPWSGLVSREDSGWHGMSEMVR